MKSLKRPHVLSSAELVARILEQPALMDAVRALPGATLARLIERVGLEDAGTLVTLASTAQLARVWDDDLWRAAEAGQDETFQPARFALWLQVMREAGEDALVQRLVELPQDLVALAFHRLVLVLDMDVLAEELGEPGDEAAEIEKALETSTFEEWEEFRVVARQPDVWDDVWSALVSLDRDHHDRLRAILEQCCAMSTEYISGQGGLFQVLTADEMLDSDVAADRDDRRSSEGFVSPADARAFLALAKQNAEHPDSASVRDPITRAYFRNLGAPNAPHEKAEHENAEHTAPEQPKRGAEAKAPADSPLQPPGAAELGPLVALLQEAEILEPTAAALLPALTAEEGRPAPDLTAPLFEEAMVLLRERDPELFSERVRELGYLVNVWMAGGTHEGRRPRPAEARERVLRTCETALRARLLPDALTPERALAALMTTPADLLFRQGFSSGVG